MWTEKSCGPDTPTLVSETSFARRRGQESPVPKESTKDTVKTIAQGMPDDLAEPVVTAAWFFASRRAMGEAIARHSLRPLSFQGAVRSNTSDAIRAARRRTRILSCLTC